MEGMSREMIHHIDTKVQGYKGRWIIVRFIGVISRGDKVMVYELPQSRGSRRVAGLGRTMRGGVESLPYFISERGLELQY